MDIAQFNIIFSIESSNRYGYGIFYKNLKIISSLKIQKEAKELLDEARRDANQVKGEKCFKQRAIY